jgi:hypothetical protein
LAAALLPVAGAGAPVGDGPVTTVHYLKTEVSSVNADGFGVRAAFDIDGRPDRWYTVYFQLRLDERTPLKTADGQELNRSWGSVFTPDNVTAAPRWSDCRFEWKFKDIEAAANLPKGKRTALWVVFDIWDVDAKKYIGSGWDARTTLVVETDAAGKVVKAEPFETASPVVRKNDPEKTVELRECELNLKHLKLKPRVKVYQNPEAGPSGPRTVLVSDDGQADLGCGAFFEPIDTPEKAREFVELSLSRKAILKTPGQFKAVVAALKIDKSRVTEPPSYGLTVTPEPGLGYRVWVLYGYPENDFVLGGDVDYVEYCVTTDGRIGARYTHCVSAPWNGPSAPPVSNEERREWYDAFKAALKADDSEVIPERVKATDKNATVPAPKAD